MMLNSTAAVVYQSLAAWPRTPHASARRHRVSVADLQLLEPPGGGKSQLDLDSQEIHIGWNVEYFRSSLEKSFGLLQ